MLNMGPGMGPGGYRVVPLQHPPGPHPSSHTPGTPSRWPVLRLPLSVHGGQDKYGRGAHIRRPTHLRVIILRVKRLDRGL